MGVMGTRPVGAIDVMHHFRCSKSEGVASEGCSVESSRGWSHGFRGAMPCFLSRLRIVSARYAIRLASGSQRSSCGVVLDDFLDLEVVEALVANRDA